MWIEGARQYLIARDDTAGIGLGVIGIVFRNLTSES
jgi:hypothetical protein